MGLCLKRGLDLNLRYADLGRAPLLVSGMGVVLRCLSFDPFDLQVNSTRDRCDARRGEQRRMARGAVQVQRSFQVSEVWMHQRHPRRPPS